MEMIRNSLVLKDFIMFNLAINSQKQWSSGWGGRGMLHVAIPQTLIRKMSFTSSVSLPLSSWLDFYSVTLSSPAEIL